MAGIPLKSKKKHQLLNVFSTVEFEFSIKKVLKYSVTFYSHVFHHDAGHCEPRVEVSVDFLSSKSFEFRNGLAFATL